MRAKKLDQSALKSNALTFNLRLPFLQKHVFDIFCIKLQLVNLNY